MQGKPVSILFVCHGNICRSPSAEFIMKHLAAQAGLMDRFVIASAATSDDELGSGVYPPARQKLLSMGIPVGNHRARQLTRADYARYDLLLGMDAANIRNMRRITGGDPDGKIRRLLEYADCPRDVADPWYTRDFDRAYADIHEGCAALLAELQGLWQR